MSGRAEAVVNSALWAAYGDALGFVTELADESKLIQRARSSRVDHLIAWHRHLPNSRRPVRVSFSAGIYSDDTQLRLATGRTIRADGTFDVAAFAKVELPTWTNYALGAGIGTKEAAFSLTKASTQWYSNFFETKRGNYLQGGGNGAAMRVQPHVWAAPSGTPPLRLLRDVFRNAVCTHGHPRGIVGAAFHALCLHHYLEQRQPANSSDLRTIALSLEDTWLILSSDPDLQLFWTPQWAQTDEKPEDAFREAVLELVNDLETLQQLSATPNTTYGDGLRSLGLFDAKARGSGTKTAVAAAWLASKFSRRGPQAAIVEAANELGSDTDTIATMAGALLGAIAGSPPEQPVQDQEYIVAEARRLAQVSSRTATQSFGYPDLRSYKPPKTAVDAVYADGDDYVVIGLGRARPLGPFLTSEEPNGDLRWLKLEFGQTLLARIRQSPKRASAVAGNLFEPPRSRPITEAPANVTPIAPRSPPPIERLVDEVARGGFDPKQMGQVILRLTEESGDHYLEQVASFTALVAHAYRRSRK